MKTNRLLQIALTACLLCMTVTVCAQVTIGSGKKPENFSALELISNGKTGMRLPHLTTKDRNLMADTYKSDPDKNDLAKGLTIFNTTTNCLEFWNGSKWISQCEGELPPYTPAPEDGKATINGICIPYMLTYQTMNMSASYSGATPTSYQWVVDDKYTSTDASFDYTPPANITLETDELGNRKKTVKIICQMEVNGNVIQSKAYDILVVHVPYEDKDKDGIHDLQPIYVNIWDEQGINLVKTAFAHVNLGDEDVINPCDMAGDLYQWGRQTDEHQKYDSEVIPGYASGTHLDTDGQIATTSDKYGNFISSTTGVLQDWRNPKNNLLWGDGSLNYTQAKAIPGDPCPRGWKVPSGKQWNYIIWNEEKIDAPNTATANTWTFTGIGFKIADALYLPPAGVRSWQDGSINERGTSGYY